MNFSVDIVVEGEVLGKIIGGQVLPKEPDEDAFRKLAVELGINPDDYIKALRKVPIKTEESIRSSADLLGKLINMIVNLEYERYKNNILIDHMESDISQAVDLISEINQKSSALDKIESKQRILSLNASIEAARAGEFGRGCTDPQKLDQKSNNWRSVFLWQKKPLGTDKKPENTVPNGSMVNSASLYILYPCQSNQA